MDAFIARKDDREILVVLKDDMVIERPKDKIRARARWFERKRELFGQKYEITHISSEAPEVKKIKKVKRVEIMKGRYIVEEEK